MTQRQVSTLNYCLLMIKSLQVPASESKRNPVPHTGCPRTKREENIECRSFGSRHVRFFLKKANPRGLAGVRRWRSHTGRRVEETARES